MPSLPPLRQPLVTPRVLVRDSAERDIPEILIAYQDDPQLHVRLAQERPPSGAELGRLAESEAAERVAGTRATLTILEPGSDDCRGQVYVENIDWEHRRAELALWVAPTLRSRGLGSGALILVSAWLLEACGIERVQLLTEPGNRPMVGAATAAGFLQEGVLRGYVRRGGHRLDTAMLSMLSTDMMA